MWEIVAIELTNLQYSKILSSSSSSAATVTTAGTMASGGLKMKSRIQYYSVQNYLRAKTIE